MKKLINIFYLFPIILFFSTNSISQQRDILIRISPTIGDQLSLTERNYYGLYPGIDEFINAEFYLRDNKFLITKILYKNNLGNINDTVIVENKSLLGNFRANIRRIDEERYENMENSEMMTLTTKDGKYYTGKLLDIISNKLFMTSSLDVDKIDLLNKYWVFNKSDIKSVFFKGGGPETFTKMGRGFLFGAGTGVLLGLISGRDEGGGYLSSPGSKALISGIALGFVGAIVGLITSINSDTPDVLIKIETNNDFNNLKKYLSSYIIE